MRNEAFRSANSAPLIPGNQMEVERFEIDPVLSSTLPEVAGFLHRWRVTEAAESVIGQHAAEDPRSIERRLRWLMLDNPAATQGSRLGYCVRDRRGAIRGLTLTFPANFLCGANRLPGLCAGSFFVEAPARSMGFYLFRKYLASPGYSFFFATTCNANSAGLWKSLGGRAIPDSDVEYVLPFRLDVMIPAFVAARTSSEVASRIARISGKCANPILRRLTRRPEELAVEPCRDWEKLAALARRDRTAASIASDRSAEYLQWRYGPGSPQYPCGIYLFRDKRGNEGWFSLGNLIRGERGQIRGSVLLDAVWPREKMSFSRIFHAIVLQADAGADALFLQPRHGIDYRKYSRCVMRRRFVAPQGFVAGRKGDPPAALDSFDYDDIDHTAWTFQWK